MENGNSMQQIQFFRPAIRYKTDKTSVRFIQLKNNKIYPDYDYFNYTYHRSGTKSLNIRAL